jgi:hypothetical protein
MRWLAALLLSTLPALAEGERAGDFDYYVLSLSWSPTWCALKGDAQGSPQCDRALGWVLHGLWPQHEDGWPSFCRTTAARSDAARDSGDGRHHGDIGPRLVPVEEARPLRGASARRTTSTWRARPTDA